MRGVGLSLSGSTPRILIISSKMTRLLAPFTFISIRAISSFMRTTTNSTFQRLTHIPHPARVALDVTLKRYMVIKRHTDNSCTGCNILESCETLVRDVMDSTKRQKSQTDPNITRLIRQIVYINGRDWIIRRRNIQKMHVNYGTLAT